MLVIFDKLRCTCGHVVISSQMLIMENVFNYFINVSCDKLVFASMIWKPNLTEGRKIKRKGKEFTGLKKQKTKNKSFVAQRLPPIIGVIWVLARNVVYEFCC